MARVVEVTPIVTVSGPKAKCPFCGVVNEAVFAEDGTFVWWPNEKYGKWCLHCRGVYTVRRGKPVFRFEK